MYLFVKLLHIVSVVAFLGNITTGLLWHAHAARTREAKTLAHTMDGIIRSDRLFTIPGVVGIVITGFVAAILGEYPILGTGWILWTVILFSISGLIFMVRVAPLQRRLRAMAAEGAALGAFDHAGYGAVALRWEIWGAAIARDAGGGAGAHGAEARAVEPEIGAPAGGTRS